MPRRLLAVIVLILSAACDRSPTAPPVVPGASGLRITGPSIVPPGTIAAFKAILSNGDGSTDDVSSLAEWSSSDPGILHVNANGIAVGISAGEAKITARYLQIDFPLTVLVMSEGTHKLSGAVTEREGGFLRGILGATIEVVQGTGIGLRTTTTDFSGAFHLYGVAGDVQLKVTAGAYETRLVNLTVRKAEYLPIDLIPLEGPPGALSGKWMLTIVAPPCSFLPEAARTRQFFAELSHTGSSRLNAKLSSQSVTHSDVVIGQTTGEAIVLPLPYWPGDIMEFPYYALIDSLQPKGSLGFRGMIRATVNGSSASGVLDGAIDFYPDKLIADGALPCPGQAAVTLKRAGDSQ